MEQEQEGIYEESIYWGSQPTFNWYNGSLDQDYFEED